MIFKTSQGEWNLDIPKNYHTAVIKMSGGADSAIMAYCLCLYKRDERPDLKLIVATSNGYPPKSWHTRNVTWVCDKISELTGVDLWDRRQNQITKPETKYLGSDFEEQIATSEYDQFQKLNQQNIMRQEGNPLGRGMVFFNGLTMNPPENVRELYEDFHDGIKHMKMEEAAYLYERSPNPPKWFIPGKQQYEFTGNADDYESGRMMWYQPWRNWDKKAIAELYDQFGLTDSLFPLTRSCENGGDVTYIDDPLMETHCEQCWWCIERYWAFGRYI